MKKIITFIFIFSIILIFSGCNSTVKNSSGSLKVTKDDEKIILEYLDTKTNDILAPSGGKMYSSFTVLGTDKNKIYIFMLKEEFMKHDSEMIRNGGVSTPLVLNVETIDGKMKITSHKFPGEGDKNAKDMKKLFPENIRNEINQLRNNPTVPLQEDIDNRVKGNK